MSFLVTEGLEVPAGCQASVTEFPPGLWVRQPLEGKLFAGRNHMTTYDMLKGLI